jgi:hypothetical protein
VNDRDVEEAVLMKPRHRTGENGVDAAVFHPPPPDACSATRRMAGQRHPDGRSLRIIKMA